MYLYLPDTPTYLRCLSLRVVASCVLVIGEIGKGKHRVGPN